MPTEVQFRRGTTAQNNSFTGAAGELSVNSTNNSLRVHDGTTAGGFELAKADLSNTTGFGTVSAANIAIGSTIVITAGFELQNIQSLDATTTATIESAVAAAPNNFTSLDISGIGTVGSTFNVGTGGTVLSAQPGTSSVGIASAIPTATLDVFGTGKISDTLTIGSATTIAANSLKVGQTVEVTGAALKFAGVEVLNTTGVYFPTGIITASRFTGELVGAAVTTVGGLHQNTGIATISKIRGDLDGQVLSGIATVNAKLAVTGIATFNSSAEFSGFSTFHANSRYIDNIKLTCGSGSDLEIYHDGSDSYIADVGGGSLLIQATPQIQLRNSTTGIATVGANGLDVVGGTNIGSTGIVTFTEGKIGSAVTFGSYGLNIAGGTHINTAGIATVQQIKVGSAVTASASGIRISGGTDIGASSGIVTAPGGFISGVGQTTAMTIEFSGSNLILTVVGIGSTTLALA